MSMTDSERVLMSEFLDKVKEFFKEDERFSSVSDRDPDDSEREPLGPEIWMEIWGKTWIRVNRHPDKIALQVSLATRDRNVSEDVEGNALHLGDTFEELLEDGLEDAGEEDVYGVYHYHEEGVFYFESDFPLIDGWNTLKSDEVLDKVCKLILGYPLGLGRFFMEED